MGFEPLANFFFKFFRLIISVAFRFSRKSERSTRTVSMETVISSAFFFLFAEAGKSKTSMTRAPHMYISVIGRMEGAVEGSIVKPDATVIT